MKDPSILIAGILPCVQAFLWHSALYRPLSAPPNCAINAGFLVRPQAGTSVLNALCSTLYVVPGCAMNCLCSAQTPPGAQGSVQLKAYLFYMCQALPQLLAGPRWGALAQAVA